MDLFTKAARTRAALKATQLPQYSESQLVSLIHQKYEGEAYARLAQVRNGTGHRSVTRTADALVMSLWPSRGIHLYGFEVKSSRSDWLHELKKPEKAEEIARFCHFWTLVTANDQVAKLEEIPVTWGWMVPDKTGKKLITLKEPTLHIGQAPTYEFLASIFRNITDTTVPKFTLQEQILEGREALEKRLTERITREVGQDLLQTQRAHTRLKETVDKFEAASGLSIHDSTWNWGDKSRTALNWIFNGGLDAARNEMLHTASRFEEISAKLREVSTIHSPEPDYSI